MRIAIEGCCHGELDKIYSHIASLEQKNNYKVDLLLICGDFQAIRNHADLQCMAVPHKYRQLGGFHKYYLGRTKAPILTILIGGNHEASNYMWELYHGGWLAPNIYFLGFSGCVQVNGIRIAGASGIYKSNHYAWGHHEKVPYDDSGVRSIYHIRQYDVFKLAQLSPPDIFLSHDWPNTIEQHGDLQGLLRRKPFFRDEAQNGSLGSPPLLDLLKKIKPRWWFSAHLHTKFEAVYRHDGSKSKTAENPDEIQIEDDWEVEDVKPSTAGVNPDEIRIDDDEDEGITVAVNTLNPEQIPKQTPGNPDPPVSSENKETRFLALDKCLPRRDFLEVIDIPISFSSSPSYPSSSGRSPRLTFDPEWLAITRALHPFLCTTKIQVVLPPPEEMRVLVTQELEWVRQNVADAGLREVNEVQTFWRTAPGPGPGPDKPPNRQPSWYTNPQTEALMQLLQLSNKVNPVPPGVAPPMVQGSESEFIQEVINVVQNHVPRDGEIVISDSELLSADEGSNIVGGGNGGVSEVGDTSGAMYPEEPIVSGGWSPSRIVD